MKFLKFSILSFVAFSVFLSVFTGCKKEGDTIVQGDTTIINQGDTIIQAKTNFVLYVNYDADVKGKLDVVFSSTNMSVIPVVKINGTALKNLDFEEGIYLEGFLDSTKTVTYSVSANGKTTSGEITIPNAPDILSINDVNYTNGDFYLTVASKYTLKYSNSGASQYKVRIYNYSIDDYVATYTAATTFDLPERHCDISILGINGFDFVTGTGPNVKGDYGDGYVIASSKSQKSYGWAHASNNQVTSATIQSAAASSKKSNDLFNEAIRIMKKNSK